MSELASVVKIEPKNNWMQCEHKCAELQQHPMLCEQSGASNCC